MRSRQELNTSCAVQGTAWRGGLEWTMQEKTHPRIWIWGLILPKRTQRRGEPPEGSYRDSSCGSTAGGNVTPA